MVLEELNVGIIIEKVGIYDNVGIGKKTPESQVRNSWVQQAKKKSKMRCQEPFFSVETNWPLIKCLADQP